MTENTKNKSTFNPVKQTEAGKKALTVKWSTDALCMAIKGLDQGQKLVANPFYENNTKLLKGDLVYVRTKDEINEWVRCSKDIIYFANKYCKLMTPEGIQHVRLRDYQERYLKHLQEHRLSIYLSCRQSGKTTSSAIFMLWYILFNIDKNSLVLGNKRKTSIEVLDKVKKIFLELPYFLKPGIYKWNEAEICFDNGCRCMAEATTINSGISFTFHCVLADEFAHIPPNIKESFYNNIFPTITAAKARFMITSTQNGMDLFARLYIAAQEGENEYAAFETNWQEVPEWNPEKRCWEQRTEDWHRQQVGNLGGEEAFQKQFGCSFITSSSTLISSKTLATIKQRIVPFVHKDVYCAGNEYMLWHPDYNIEKLRNDYFVVTVDISEGIDKDYTVFTMNRIRPETDTEMLYTDTVGYFRCNRLSIKECAESLCDFCEKYLDGTKYLINIEWNTYGAVFVRYMLEYIDRMGCVGVSQGNLVKYYNESGTRFNYGCKMTHNTKVLACKNFKEDYERGRVVNVSLAFYNEALQFVDINGNSKFEASYGNDDLMMSQINLEMAKDNPQFKYFIEEMVAAVSQYTYGNDDITMADIYSLMSNRITYANAGLRERVAGMQLEPDIYSDVTTDVAGQKSHRLR